MPNALAYVYIWDEDFGPGFIKICSYFPYPVKAWLNGHEWAKRQAARAGIAFTELSNGFASCADPAALQAICDRLGPQQIQAWFDRWLSRLPLPLTAADQAAGYWWELSMRQVETSRTLVFDAPRHARAFFGALVADNIDLGRPEQVEIIFGRARGRKAGGVQDEDRPARSGRHPQRVLQELACQAVPERRPGPAHRDRHQRRLQSAQVRANVCMVAPEVHRSARRMSWTWSAA
jgi:hypothetical protein